MNFLIHYLKQQKGSILLYLSSGILLTAAFALYRLPMAALAYPLSLCALLGLLFLTAGFLRARKEHRALTGLLADCEAGTPSFDAALLTAHPDWKDADCQAILRAMQAQLSGQEARQNARYQEMLDYFTLWAHQVKTPISSMRLALDNEDSPLSWQLSADLFSLEQYVEMALTFLRLDFASTDYVFREHAVDDILRPAIARFASRFIGQKIRLEYAPLEWTVITDDKWLSFVIEQLLSNALKYTRPGGVIRIFGKSPRMLYIEDTGIGIAPEDLPRIFEKGYTGGNGRRDKRASGIGLYLCRRICDSLNIRLGIISTPGQGTRASLDLSQSGRVTE